MEAGKVSVNSRYDWGPEAKWEQNMNHHHCSEGFLGVGTHSVLTTVLAGFYEHCLLHLTVEAAEARAGIRVCRRVSAGKC